MIKYLILDDETIAHDIIKGYCDMLPDMQLQKHCYDAIEALAYLKDHNVDLIFLDLNMPKLKGFDFLKTLAQPPKIIVTTAYKEYAIEGYELDVIDYLLKPFSFERFLKAVQKVNTTTNNPINRIAIVDDNSTATIFFKSNKQYVQVNIADILYLESAGNYVKVVTTREIIMVREKISDLAAKMPKAQFIKVHKSFAVAITHINRIVGNRIFIGQYQIPVGKTYRSSLEDLLR